VDLPSTISGVGFDGDMLAVVGYSDTTGDMELTVTQLP